ncbi:uncharacterized protein LOC122922499 isoform X2 [Bufo gargarizans]|uniref:uncharacterized protein LOC122919920 n=1 Tax=Bufo gargarizans TaxID=30331 RepID=UPI001CF58786|nr:uncharacterized protein LOC122919920 [Bufo gargarizans]XP_044129047.1 uncharacterized protein LOC122922499 isoform X2 [Bufo gargarizans]
MTNVFSYDTSTADSIVSGVNLSSDFLHIPSHELKIRDYERDRKRLIGWELHCSTLAEYYRTNRIPRGLRSRLRPTLFSDNTEFSTRFENILNKCSFDIILLTIEQLQKSIEDLSKKIEITETTLITTAPEEEWKKAKDKIEKQLSEYKKHTELNKRQKFVRDAEDYRLDNVYRWKKSPQYNPWNNRYQQYSGSSSDSDRSGNYKHPARFLGNRRRGRGPGPGAPGEVAGDSQGSQVQTRSQTR